ncbi:unnamed protein product [Closterium sp. NIES-54]
MDLVGPMRTEGTEGVLYFLTMVDEWSRFMWARPLSKKSDAAATIKEDWLPMVERQAMRLLTCPGTPQQIGIAERTNQTIDEVAKTLLGAAGMPYKFWPEAVRHAITVKNRVLTHVGDKHWVPYERWLGKKPSIDMLRVWGCMGLVMVPGEQRNKHEVAAVWAVHLGMAPDSKGWLMWDPKSKRTLVSRDVKLVEDVMYKDWQQQQQQVQIGLHLQEIERSAVEEVQLHLDKLHGSELTSDHSGGGEQQVSGPAGEEGSKDESARVDSPTQPEPAATAKVTKRSVQRGASRHGQQTTTREKRVAAPPSRLKYSCLGGPKQGAMAVQADEGEDEEMAFCFFTPLPGEPATVEEALRRKRGAWMVGSKGREGRSDGCGENKGGAERVQGEVREGRNVGQGGDKPRTGAWPARGREGTRERHGERKGGAGRGETGRGGAENEGQGGEEGEAGRGEAEHTVGGNMGQGGGKPRKRGGEWGSGERGEEGSGERQRGAGRGETKRRGPRNEG